MTVNSKIFFKFPTFFGVSGDFDWNSLMGPVRGNKKKRKMEKKAEENSLVSGSSEEGSTDWWDVLSKTITGKVNKTLVLFSC